MSVMMRTVVITIAYEPDAIADPATWLPFVTHPLQPTHYAVIGAMCPVSDPLPIHGAAKISDLEKSFTLECVMPTNGIRDWMGNPA